MTPQELPFYGSLKGTQRSKKTLEFSPSKTILVQMTKRRAQQSEALRAWREAEGELVEGGDGTADLEDNVARLRGEYQHLYTEDMTDNLARLHEADDRRANSVPSSPEFHSAVQDTKSIAADIWEEAQRGDEGGPQGQEARENR